MNAFLVTFQGSPSQLYFTLCYVTTFLLKTPLDGYWQLLNLLWPESCRVMFVCGSKIQAIKKKCNENFI